MPFTKTSRLQKSASVERRPRQDRPACVSTGYRAVPSDARLRQGPTCKYNLHIVPWNLHFTTTPCHLKPWLYLQDNDDDNSDDDNSDDDIDDTMAAVSISQGTAKHKLQFLVGDRVLPYNMTVYQAVKQFSHAADREGSETDTDSEHPYGHAGIWVQSHHHMVCCAYIFMRSLRPKVSSRYRNRKDIGIVMFSECDHKMKACLKI